MINMLKLSPWKIKLRVITILNIWMMHTGNIGYQCITTAICSAGLVFICFEQNPSDLNQCTTWWNNAESNITPPTFCLGMVGWQTRNKYTMTSNSLIYLSYSFLIFGYLISLCFTNFSWCYCNFMLLLCCRALQD